MAMTEMERWQEAAEALKGEPLTLSPRISGTVRKSLTGWLHILARYKFAMKMMMNRDNITVMDFGCNDGLGTLMLRQNLNAKSIVGIDFDSDAVKWAKENLEDDVLKFAERDFLSYAKCTGGGGADCIVSLDVIEHIPQEKEKLYRDAVFNCLNDKGFAVIGTPNVTLFPYANPINRKAHINNYDQKRLYDLFSEKFSNIFFFGLNDESINTGFYPFSCYIMALCCK